MYQALGLLGEEETPLGWNSNSQVQAPTRKEPSAWGLGSKLHTHSFSVGSPLPAYSCERTHTHTHTALDCVLRRSQNQRERWLDNVSTPLLPMCTRFNSINGLLPSLWGDYLQPTRLILQHFFFLSCICMEGRDRTLQACH